MDVIYTDFSKAFDSIDHKLLLAKLESFGFCPSLVELMSSYITNRTGFVFYNGYSSNIFAMPSGVPQGSNLGPLLFNIYINDLLVRLNCLNLGYADDLKIYSTVNTPQDCIKMQTNLAIIFQWSKLNKIHLNIEKCSVVSFTRCVNPILYDYTVGSELITRRDSMKDLGILFDSKLTFSEHISTICLSASRLLGFVIRSARNFNNINTITTLYYALVRSKLEYASVVWYPFYTYQQLSIERIQKRFLKYIVFKATGTYPDYDTTYTSLLDLHSFQTLSHRRELYSAKFFSNILSHRLDCASLLSWVNFHFPTRDTRN